MLCHLVMHYCNEHQWTPPKFEVHFSAVFRWFLQGAAMFTTRQLMQRTDVMKRLAHHPRFDAWTNERGRSWRFGKAPTFWVVIQSVGFGYLLYDAVWILFFGYRNIYCEFYHVNLVVWCHLSSEGKSCSRDSIELVFGGAYAARSFWAHFDLNQPQTSLQMVVHLRKDSEGT